MTEHMKMFNRVVNLRAIFFALTYIEKNTKQADVHVNK